MDGREDGWTDKRAYLLIETRDSIWREEKQRMSYQAHCWKGQVCMQFHRAILCIVSERQVLPLHGKKDPFLMPKCHSSNNLCKVVTFMRRMFREYLNGAMIARRRGRRRRRRRRT